MANAQVRDLVILAAGKGTRIRGEKQPLPKPLVRCGGLTLLKRSLLTARKEGVERAIIVVGCDGDQVQAAIDGDPELDGIELVWVHNPDYELSNGVSVLKARPHVRGEFFLTMADHVMDPAIFRTLQAEPARGGLVLAVDRKLATIFDMDDATKVRTGPKSRIAEIGKEISNFDAVDTGLFRCDPALFEAIDRVYQAKGDASLSHGVKHLSESGKARVADIGEAWWQDADTMDTIKHAEKLLFRSLTKSIDGPVSKHINRRFSKTITRLVMNTNIVPNHMTALGLVIGVASAVVTAFATAQSLWLLAVGGVLYQLSSMIDGCDGEIARLKYKHSDWGEWFDTVSDDVINLSYQLALGYALFNISGQSVWLQIGIASFVLGWVLCAALYRRLINSGKGTHLAIEWDFQRDPSELGWFQRAVAKVEFIGHRDAYALVLMVCTFIGVLAMQIALVASCVTILVVGSQLLMTGLNEQTARKRAGEGA